MIFNQDCLRGFDIRTFFLLFCLFSDDDEEDGDEEETEESSDEEEEDGPGLAGKFKFLLQNFHRKNLPFWIHRCKNKSGHTY